MKIYDVIILGAGASGLMCASFLDKSLSIAMIDSNLTVGAKLKVSGGGKCNFTNVEVSEKNFEGDEYLVQSVLGMFSRDDLLNFLNQHNFKPVIKKGRYYFCKNSSTEIINILKNESKHAEFLLNTKIQNILKEDNYFFVKTNNNTIKAKKVIVATGGKSFSTLGASDIGLSIADFFSINSKAFTPALVGLTVQKEQFWMKELSGLSCYVHISVGDKILKEELLFTHKGVSGPCVLSASLYWKKGVMSINFLPNEDIRLLIKNTNKLISSALPLPKRFVKIFLEVIGVRDIECNKITKDMKEKLLNIHKYQFSPAGNFGFSKAEVSSGGILADELNMVSLESIKVKNLYFIGEVVDVTGELGGYNFQWAFSSAVACAKNINEIT
jgi:predicted Rossmann fold flavoprotein